MKNRLFRRIGLPLLLALCIFIVLLILKYLAFSVSLILASILSGVIAGMLFTVISVVFQYIRSGGLGGLDRLNVYVFSIGLGAGLFLIGSKLGHGIVFGINFTKTGPIPISAFNGEIVPIAFVGGLIGAVLSYGALVDYGFQHSNIARYFSLVWVLGIGGFFATAISILFASPFIAVSFFTRAFVGLLINKLDASQYNDFIMGTLILSVTILPLALVLEFI